VESGPCDSHESSAAGRLLGVVQLPPPPSLYGERDALRFKAEHDESQRELGKVSKKAGIAEL
jgi:hypothetical protein